MARLIRGLALSLGVGVAALAASCSPSPPSARSSSPPPAGTPRVVQSNVLRADYAGTAACARCHSDKVEAWLRTPMHNMTRDASQAVIGGPFDGTVFSFHGDTAKLETVGGARFVTLTSKRFGSGVFRVTRVIGGNHREDYAGVAVAAARPDAELASGPSEELVLPVSWVHASEEGTPAALRYKGYSVMVNERPGLRAGPAWNQTCIFCHNTAPFVDTVLGALAGPRARPYQGEVVDPLLPPARRAVWSVTDDRGLASALDAELSVLHGARSERTLPAAVEAVRRSFRREHLVELGIGCESCHLGAAEHVADPRRLPSLEPASPLFRVTFPKLAGKGELSARETRAAAINRACARCHQVLFSGYEPTWEGGARHGRGGGSNINSGEARDLLLGACASQLSCAGCHDPHAPDGTKRLRALGAAEKDALCTGCHAEYATPAALRAHAHHDPAGEGARCLSCHMPKKNLALDGSLSRYHRIGSPNDPERVLLDRPIECALCHADRTVLSLAMTMESWWKRPYDRAALRALYGDLDANVIVATAERGKPHEQAVAFHVLGAAGDRAALPVLAAQLTHPYPLVRGYAKRALDRLNGSPVPIDMDGEDAAIEAAARAFAATLTPARGSSR
ncbi:MAG: hypothetical protein JWP97_4674 [Labilithrix sp.]|nr:hypothetical protein [Labilithrix sp.]